jgi:iron complex outermembrane recepter protein
MPVLSTFECRKTKTGHFCALGSRNSTYLFNFTAITKTTTMRKFAICLLAMLCCAMASIAQTVIKGKVLDRNGQPVEGASVKEKGTGNGVVTDKDGNYSIKVGSNEAVLVFSGAGMAEQERSVKGSSYIEATMSSSAISLGDVAVVGTRSLRRSATETAVPIDVIPISKITNTLGQVDLNQILQYVAPSFNSNRQSGSDGADHIDPATLRGLGPDQTLVLVNGKRRHQSSLVNLYGTRGRGNSGTDLNAIPAAAIERIEILRDGAAAQYGSDAIAGVINIVLKSASKGGSANVSAGMFQTGYGSTLKSPDNDGKKVIADATDGLTINGNVNYGFALKNNGFVNITADYFRREKTKRPNYEKLFPDNYRREFGEAGNENYSFYLNTAFPLKGKAEFYAFGGINHRKGDAFAFTRDASSERNVLSIYPDGFDPRILSTITDKAVAFGIRTKICGWNSDFFANLGGNRFAYDVHNTVNASLEGASPTKFDAGGFQLNQNAIGANFSKSFSKVAKGANVAFGAELRQEQYKIFAGELGSYKQYGPVVFAIDPSTGDTTFRPGGSQGFPGYQPKDETNRQRVSGAWFVDGELDITKSFLVSAAVRAENFSDFGWTVNYKLATRIKYSDRLSFRGSFSTGFRAPSLPQKHFSSTFTNVAAGEIYDIVIAPNDGILAKTAGIPQLKQETSTNFSFGFTAKPAKNFVLTVDGYSVNIKDKVVLTGLFDNNDDVLGDILNGLNVGAAQFFTNAVSTRTTGVDVIATYGMNAGKGKLNFTFAGNFNNMKLGKITTTPQLAGKEDIYYSRREQYFLLASAPPHKLSLATDYKIGNFNINVRATNFAGVKIINFGDEEDVFKQRTTLDLSFNYNIKNKASITLGGANILDVYPSIQDPGLSESGGMWDAVQMGFGGAFFFAKVGVKLK